MKHSLIPLVVGTFALSCGSSAPSSDGSASFPKRFEIDYLRVFQKQ